MGTKWFDTGRTTLLLKDYQALLDERRKRGEKNFDIQVRTALPSLALIGLVLVNGVLPSLDSILSLSVQVAVIVAISGLGCGVFHGFIVGLFIIKMEVFKYRKMNPYRLLITPHGIITMFPIIFGVFMMVAYSRIPRGSYQYWMDIGGLLWNSFLFGWSLQLLGFFLLVQRKRPPVSSFP